MTTKTDNTIWMVVWTTVSPNDTAELMFESKQQAQVFKAEHPLGKYASVVRAAQ
jgi:hypothetical protein